ncbi:acyl-CoA synthetase [Acrasis kona]|uniref:Acyl-CoA synthetase n=1 Tax=Acrasis kona TaxID=1008807 RepID=A0AAW2YWV9_9EUKA
MSLASRATLLNKTIIGARALKTISQCRSYAKAESNDRHSIISNDEKVNLVDKTIGYILSRNARAQPYANAFRSPQQKDAQYTNVELKKYAEAIACGFVELGLRIGDRVGVIQNATAEQFLVQLACAKVGAIAAQFTDIKNAKDLTRYLDLFRPNMLVMPSKASKVDYYRLVLEAFPELNTQDYPEEIMYVQPIKTKRFPFLKQIFFTDRVSEPIPGTYHIQDAHVYGPFGYYESPLRRIALKINVNNPAFITLESSLDKGKNIVWTQSNVLNAANICVEAANIKFGDVVFVAGYQNSAFGLISNYAAFLANATLVYPCEEFDAAKVMDHIQTEKCTVLFVRSKDADALMSYPDDVDISSVRAIFTDAETEDVKNNLKRKFTNAQVKSIHGLDTLGGLAMLDGNTVPGTQIKITRNLDDRIVHKDTFGDVRVRGQSISSQHWNDIGLMNADVDEDGWVKTGRMGKVDDKNKLQVQ